MWVLWTLLWIVISLGALSLLGAVLYIVSTYVLLWYDRSLAAQGLLKPAYQFTEHFPRGWARRRAIIGEILTVWALAWIFLPAQFPARVPKARHRSTPIVLVHGFDHNRSAWFVLRSRLKRAGFHNIYALNLRRGNHSIEDHAVRLAEYAQRVEKRSGVRELILIGHSMGGLVAGHYTERLAAAGRVSHVITLGTPLHGTRSASMVHTRCSQQMRMTSGFTEELSREIAANPHTQYFHLASWYDNIIFPHQSALLGQRLAHEHIIDDLGHLSMLFSKRVATQVIDWLRRAVPIRQTQEMPGRTAPAAAPEAPVTHPTQSPRNN